MHRLLILCFSVFLAGCAARGPEITERNDLRRYFQEAGTDGTMVVFDPTTRAATVVNAERAKRAYSPASTFKIANSLIGLETGAIRDVDEVFPWDGTPFIVDGKPFKQCDADLTLREAIRYSCVPAFQQVARRVGRSAYDHWLKALDYGNAEAGGAAVDAFWLQGDLRMTAWQQVDFLTRLAAGVLPVRPSSLAQVKDILVVEQSGDFVLRAKTGWSTAGTPSVGWWVGWVEKNGRTWVFALNLDMTRSDLAKARVEIGKALLRELGAL